MTCLLSEMPQGGNATVVDFNDTHLAQRMLMLGVRRGTNIQIVQGPNARGTVIMVGGARLALGREAADGICVNAT